MSDLNQRVDVDGYVSPIRIMSKETAYSYRDTMEAVEEKVGNLHFRFKIHTALPMAYEIANNEKLLDAVVAVLGPNILLYNATYLIKEPHTTTHVSWHQDLTYWGFSDDKVLTAWVALSEVNEESGCMYVLPGSHKNGEQHHQTTEDDSNILYLGQTVHGVDNELSKALILKPGEMSLHNGWILHTSHSNTSDDRRIGLTLNYISTDMRQTENDEDTAILVRGVDEYKHFKPDTPAIGEFTQEAWVSRQKHEDRMLNTYNQTKS